MIAAPKSARVEQEVAIASLKAASYNPRKISPAEFAALKDGIARFGFADPVVANSKNRVVVGGHQRLKAAEVLGMTHVPVAWLPLTKAEERALNLALNRIGGEFDDAALKALLTDLATTDLDLGLTGFGDEELAALLGEATGAGTYGQRDPGAPSLADTWGAPPFSVLDAKQGYWVERKKAWIALGIDSGEGRGEDLLDLAALAKKTGSNLTGTSIFDPVLTELMVRWFSPPGGCIIDPFAGGSVRGAVSALLGRTYTGVDLRAEQVQANLRQWQRIVENGQALAGSDPAPDPTWVAGDSLVTVPTLAGAYDMALTCPPYVDLEKYSDDPSDLSNMPWADFLRCYRGIIKATAEKLKDNSFFVVVVGEVRSKKGDYLNFVGETVNALIDAGLKYYNEAILVTAIGSLSVRAGRTFKASRKLGKTHQNIIVFVKGDWKKAAENCGQVHIPSGDDEDEEN